MNERKSKNIVIIALCITLIFMGVGFSILSQTLTINGSASVDANSSWSIQIDNIEPVDAVYAGTAVSSADLNKFVGTPDQGAIPTNYYGTVTKTTTTGEFKVNFIQPGDYVIYKITTGNHGTLDAVLDAAVISTTGDNDTDTSPNYTVAQDGTGEEIYSYQFGTLSGTTFTPGAPVVANYTLDGGDYVNNPNNLQAAGNVFYVKVMYNDTEVNPGVLTSEQKTSSATITFTYNQTTNS